MSDCNGLKYLQCAKCAQSRPDGEAMRDYARLSVAVTPSGDLLVTCARHRMVVAHIDNAEIGDVLAKIALEPCGCDKHAKETLH